MKDGFLLIDKESGYTSRDVCNVIGKRLRAKKVGHSGTLDPFATGLLVVGINNATKTLGYLEGQHKTYEASLLLGSRTDSGDLTGQIIQQKAVRPIEIKEIQDVFSSLLGKSEQIVPLTSAVHVNGKKLYQYAHEHEEVELPSREIEIFDLELISFTDNILSFKAIVSKGTYLRVLGETIAEKLLTIGHLISLRRTDILDINVSRAKQVKTIEENDLLPIGDVLRKFMPILILANEDELKKANHGGKLSLKLFKDIIPLFCVSDDKNNIIAIYEYCELGYYKCVRGLYFENN